MSHTDWRTSGHRTPKTNYPSKIIQFLFWFRECFGVNITMRIDIYGSIEAWVFLIQNVFSVCNLCPYPIRAMVVHRLGQGWQVEWPEEEQWPIRGQYSGHVTSIDQSEASIPSVYPLSPPWYHLTSQDGKHNILGDKCLLWFSSELTEKQDELFEAPK